jgi:hypothetical protein
LGSHVEGVVEGKDIIVAHEYFGEKMKKEKIKA